jgi:hypothetical protein
VRAVDLMNIIAGSIMLIYEGVRAIFIEGKKRKRKREKIMKNVGKYESENCR